MSPQRLLHRLRHIPFPRRSRLKGHLKHPYIRTVTLVLHALLMATAVASELTLGQSSVSNEVLDELLTSSGRWRRIAAAGLVAKGEKRPHELPTESSLSTVTESATTAPPAVAVTTTTMAPVTTRASPTTARTQRDSAPRTTAPASTASTAQPEISTTSASAAQQQPVASAPSLSSPATADNSVLQSIISPFPVEGLPTMWPGEMTLSGQAVPHWGTTATLPTYSTSIQLGIPSRPTFYTAQQSRFRGPLSALTTPMSIQSLLPLAALNARARPVARLPRGVWPSASASLRRPQANVFDDMVLAN